MAQRMTCAYWDIEVSPQMHNSIREIFEILGLSLPAVITHKEMEKVYKHLKMLVNNNNQRTYQSGHFRVIENKLRPMPKEETEVNLKQALIISNLGIIRYQLKNNLHHKGVETKIVETLYSGLAEYVKKLHDVVIIDLHGNPDEAIQIIEEIRRVARNHSVRTKIVILSQPGQNCDKLKFLAKGVDRFIEKTNNWYDIIADFFDKQGKSNNAQLEYELPYV